MFSVSRLAVVFSFVLTSFTSQAANADEPVLLRYKFGKDDKLIYSTTTKVKQTQKFAEMTVETEVDMEDISIRTFESVDDKGVLAIRNENKLLKTTMSIGPLGKYEFDSSTQERDNGSVLGSQVTPIFDRLSGAYLTLKLTPRGELKAVDGYKELLGDILKKSPIGAQITGGEKGAVAKFGDMIPIMSEKAVSPGDGWEEEYELEMPKLGKAKGKKVYKFEGFDKVGDRKTVKISVANEMSFDLKLDAGGAKTTGTLSITKSEGTIQFDAAKGQLVSMKQNYTMEGNINVTVADNAFNIENKQVMSVNVDLLDKLPE